MSTYTIDQVTPQLNALAARVENPLPGLMAAGRGVQNLLRTHYRQKHKDEPNKLGGKRTDYWLGVAHAVNQPTPAGDNAVMVSISHPSIKQKIYGGTITAKRSRFLTIPVDARAYGRSAATLEQSLGIKLFVITGGGRAFLAGRMKEGRRGMPLRVFYVLKKSVTQRPDATALPPKGEIEQTALERFGKWVTRQSV